MLAKKEWFQRRKYGWWWVTPKTWQWWTYLWIMIGILAVLMAMPMWDNNTRTAILIVWIVILFIDIVPIMFTLDKDERETKIEAIAERNTAWTMTLILTLWILYDVIISWLNNQIEVNYFIIGALVWWVIVKSASNFILERRWE